MGNLKVNDAEYEQLSSAIKKVGETAEEQLKLYFEILQGVLEGAITAGLVFENLTIFQAQAKVLINTVGSISTTLGTDSTEYTKAIDEADEYLYS